MCGIFSLVGHLDRELALKCTRRLSHRGPDHLAVRHLDGVVLGHTRLSILDLSEAGQQPMSLGNGRWWITFNGEIYNYREIRTELESKGMTFRTDSDTEVLLAAFVQWGWNCLHRLNGMWAFTIWDSVEKTLHFSRDRFGKKPFFYARTPEGFAVASEMKALLPLLPEVRANAGLAGNSKRIVQYEASEECLIEGIRRLPAGHLGSFSRQGLKIEKWWETLDHIYEPPESYEEQVELFRELFVDACRLRLRSDVPVGTALSGGLDSSSVTAVVADLNRKGIGNSQTREAFVASFPGTPFDEAAHASKTAEDLGIKASFIAIDPVNAIDRMDEFSWYFEELYLTPPIPFMLTYEQMRSKGVTVSLDGHGADECFAGYGFDMVAALVDAGLHPGRIRSVLDARYDASDQSQPQFRLPPRLTFWTRFHYNRLKGLLAAGKKTTAQTHPSFDALDYLTRTLYTSTHKTILPTLLRNYDRYSMASGVEIRMPFMDHRLVTLAFSLPWTSKIRRGYSKSVVRSAMHGFLPREISHRKTKIGFNAPVVDWIRGPLREFFLDTVESSDFRQSDLVDKTLCKERLDGLLASEAPTFAQGEACWTAFAPYFWERALIKGKGCPASCA